jgi:ABC-type branched-subunit amino acid transport system substrate-binding protein
MMRFPLSFLVAFAAFGTSAFAETPGVSKSEVLFGQTAAIKGPAQALGLGMRHGISAAFEEANRTGGIHGRKLILTSLNDSYEPEAAIENTKRLISTDKVFALIGSVGTPTSRASEPIASQHGVPFIGSFTGAEFLRRPYRPTVINIRASYFQETEELVDRLTRELGVRRIAVLYQDDSYGRAGLAGVRAALHRRKMKLVSEGTYIRNTVAVKTALLTILQGNPQAVIIIGVYQASATFTKWARKIGLDALIANVSFVGSTALAAELGEAGKGVVVSQVVPFPEDNALPLINNYRQALQQFNNTAAGFVSLEGYLVGRVTIEALERVGPDLTREAFLEAFTSGKPFDIGGLRLTYGQDDNQGMDTVFLTVIDETGRLAPISRLSKP